MVETALVPLLSYPVLIPKPSTHRMHEAWFYGVIVSSAVPFCFVSHESRFSL
jgi:hypothetical protein